MVGTHKADLPRPKDAYTQRHSIYSYMTEYTEMTQIFKYEAPYTMFISSGDCFVIH